MPARVAAAVMSSWRLTMSWVSDRYVSVARRRMTCSSRGRNWISTVPVVNRTTMSSRFRVP